MPGPASSRRPIRDEIERRARATQRAGRHRAAELNAPSAARRRPTPPRSPPPPPEWRPVRSGCRSLPRSRRRARTIASAPAAPRLSRLESRRPLCVGDCFRTDPEVVADRRQRRPRRAHFVPGCPRPSVAARRPRRGLRTSCGQTAVGPRHGAAPGSFRKDALEAPRTTRLAATSCERPLLRRQAPARVLAPRRRLPREVRDGPPVGTQIQTAAVPACSARRRREEPKSRGPVYSVVPSGLSQGSSVDRLGHIVHRLVRVA